MCEGFGNMSRLHLGLHLYFPHLSEITIDHCSNLEELPVSVCNMPSLQRFSISNCHDLLKLSDDIGNLSSLQMLRLYACLSLEKYHIQSVTFNNYNSWIFHYVGA